MEKLRFERYETYKETFFQNSILITDLNCGIICCVPIDTLYDPKTSPIMNNYQHFTLPLVYIDNSTIPTFRRIITQRVEESVFFEEGVLDYCVEQSGGSPRQLIRIVYESLTYSEKNNFKITLQVAQKVCNNLGLDLIRRLNGPDFDKLKSGDFEKGDHITSELLFNLALMEYNGNINTRKPNPLLLPFIK